MSERVIRDLTLKIQAMENVPQDDLTSLFLEMCDLGIDTYVRVEKERFPSKTRTQIMKEYYQEREEIH